MGLLMRGLGVPSSWSVGATQKLGMRGLGGDPWTPHGSGPLIPSKADRSIDSSDVP